MPVFKATGAWFGTTGGYPAAEQGLMCLQDIPVNRWATRDGAQEAPEANAFGKAHA